MRKALIVWGGWPGHEPEKGARVIERMLSEDGFTVEVSNDYERFAAPDLGICTAASGRLRAFRIAIA